MANYLEGLAGGLRTIAGGLNPQIMPSLIADDRAQAEAQERRKTMVAQRIIQAAESGAIPPEVAQQHLQRLGLPGMPVGPSAETQTRQEAAARKRAYEAELAAAGDDPVKQRAVVMKFASPDAVVKLKTEGGYTLGPDQTRFDAAGNPIASGVSRAQRPDYKERNVSYDGKTYTREISRDGGVTWEQIPGSQPVDIRKATGGTDVRINVDPGNPLAATDRQDRRQVTQQARAADALIGELSTFLRELEQTPGAVGLRGAVGQPAAGYTGQILGPGAGNAVSRAITGASPEAVAQLRTRSQLLRSRLLPVVTNETGRYTEPERQIATEAQGALDTAQGAPQVKAASKALIIISLADRERGLKALGAPPKHDLTKPEGRLAQGRELKTLGLSDEEIAKAIRIMYDVRK